MTATQTKAHVEVVEDSRPHSTISLKADTSDQTSAAIPTLSRIPTKTPHVEAIEMVELGDQPNVPKDTPTAGPGFPATTPEMRRKANIQFATLCWTLFLGGWTSGTTGPLLPRIQEVYHASNPEPLLT